MKMKKVLSLLLCAMLAVSASATAVFAAAPDSTEVQGYTIVKDFMALNKANSGLNFMYNVADEGSRVGGNRDVSTDAATGFEYGSIEFSKSGYFGIVLKESIANLAEYNETGYILVTLRAKTGTSVPETVNVRAGANNNYYTMGKANFAENIKVGEWSTVKIPFKMLVDNKKLGGFTGNDQWQSLNDAKINNIRIVGINSNAPEVNSVLEVAELKFCADKTLYTWGECIMDGAVVGGADVITNPNAINKLAPSSKSVAYNDGYATFEPDSEESTAMGFRADLHKLLPADKEGIGKELFIRIKFKSENMPKKLKMTWTQHEDFGNAKKTVTTFVRNADGKSSWTDFGDGWMTVDIPLTAFNTDWWWSNIQPEKIKVIVFSFEGYQDGTYAKNIDVNQVAVFGPKQELVVKEFKVVNEGNTEGTAATTFTAGEKLSVKATAVNTTTSAEKLNVITALYSSDGTLIDAKVTANNAAISTAEQSFDTTFEVAEDARNAAVKAFVWTASGMTPLGYIDGLTQADSSEI